MLKNRFFAIILFSVCLLACFLPFYAHAGEEDSCLEEHQKELSEKLDDNAKKAVADMLSVYNQFKPLADAYIRDCGTSISKEDDPFSPPREDRITAQRLGVSLYPSDRYAAYNYKWDTETAPGKEGCFDKLNRARAARKAFNKAYNSAHLNLAAANTNGSGGNCTCDNEGNPVCTALTSNQDESIDEDGACLPFTGYLQQFTSHCPLCDIFVIILNTNSELSTIAWDAVAFPLTRVVLAFFLVLVALEVLKAVSAIAGSKISSLLKGVLTIGLKIAIVAALLSSPRYIYDYFVTPVISGGLDMGMAISQSSGASCVFDTPTTPLKSGAMGSSISKNIYNAIQCFANTAATTPAIGRGLICHSFGAGILGVLPDLSMWLSGVIMFLFGLMIWLAVAFYLIDCTVQLGILTALIPLLIAFWPFKMTQQYTTKGLQMMMNTFFNFALIGVVLLLGADIMTFSVTGGSDYNINDMINALNDNDIDALEKMTKLEGFQILILVACSIFALKLVSSASGLAEQFSSGSGSDIGAKMGGLATSAATSVAKAGAKSVGTAVGNAAGAAYQGSKLQANVNKTANAVQGTWARGWQKAGQAVGLGKFQNQQQGAGKAPGGDAPKPTGGNPDDGGPKPTGDNPDTPEVETPNTPPTPDDGTPTPDNSKTSDAPQNGETSDQTPKDGNNGGGDNSGGDNGGDDNSGGDNGGDDNSGGDNGGGDNGGGDNPSTDKNNQPSDNDGKGAPGSNNDNNSPKSPKGIDHEGLLKTTQMTMLLNEAKGQDNHGNKIQTTRSEDGTITQSSFDKNGNIKNSTSIDKDGNITDRFYHKNGKLASKLVFKNDGTASSERYDENGTLIPPKKF